MILKRLPISALFSGTADSTDYISSLKMLSLMLYKHYACPAIIIIDEYDTPILQGHLMGFYADMVSFMNGTLFRWPQRQS